MTKRIIWEKADGNIAVTIPIGGTDIEVVAEKAGRTIPDLQGATRLSDVEHDKLPGRYFRSCWRNGGNGKPIVNMPLAKEQRMAEIRLKRNALLADSDADKVRLDDIGTEDQKNALATYRQTLRDIPAGVKLGNVRTADKLEEFEPLWPDKDGG